MISRTIGGLSFVFTFGYCNIIINDRSFFHYIRYLGLVLFFDWSTFGRLFARCSLFKEDCVVALVAASLGIRLLVLMRTIGRLIFSTKYVVAVIAHSFGIVLSRGMSTIGYFLQLSSAIFLRTLTDIRPI